MDIKIESGFKNVFTQKAVGFGLFDRLVNALQGQRIFMPDINKTLFSAYGKGPDSHTLEHGVRIGFQYGPVHKGTRIALIRIADQAFYFVRRFAAGFPF